MRGLVGGRACGLAVVLFGLAAAASSAGAGPQLTLDPARRADGVSERRFNPPASRPAQASPSAPPVLRFEAWHGRFSPLGRERATIEERDDRSARREARPVSSAPAAAVAESPARHGWSDRRPSSLANLGRRAELPRQDDLQRRIPDLSPTVTRESYLAGPERPALDDVNRFVFRKNGANRGPVPSTPAGGSGRP